MNHKDRVCAAICFLPAAAAVIYGGIICAVNSGSRFYLVWFILGAFLFGTGACFAAGVHKKLPKASTTVIRLILLAAAALLVVTWAMILPHFGDHGQPGAAALIIPGAQVRESGPSTVLKYRLDAALVYLEKNPLTVCIVSGCQGPNEPFTEAYGMKAYLVGHGIAEDRIRMEESAQTTAENLAFSQLMLPSPDSAVVIVTNDFHMYRTLHIAAHLGYNNVTGEAAGSAKLFLPNNLLYESFAIVKNVVQGNM